MVYCNIPELFHLFSCLVQLNYYTLQNHTINTISFHFLDIKNAFNRIKLKLDCSNSIFASSHLGGFLFFFFDNSLRIKLCLFVHNIPLAFNILKYINHTPTSREWVLVLCEFLLLFSRPWKIRITFFLPIFSLSSSQGHWISVLEKGFVLSYYHRNRMCTAVTDKSWKNLDKTVTQALAQWFSF